MLIVFSNETEAYQQIQCLLLQSHISGGAKLRKAGLNKYRNVKSLYIKDYL